MTRDAATAPERPRVSRRIAAITESATLAVDAKAKAKKAAGEDVVGFGAGEPDFPTPAAVVAAAEAACSDPKNHRYTPAGGMPELKAAVAAKTARDSGFQVTPAQVLITNGGKQAVYGAFAALLDPGDVVLVEDPSYLAALQSFALAGARLVPVPGACDGPDLDAVAALVAEHRPKLLYVVPTFQNPTGRTISADGRARLARLAGELGLWLLEDDPYGELRYDGEAVPSLGSFPGAEDRTIAVSSLSKVLAPGLRIGWLRAPEELRRALTIAKQAGDLHTSTIDQMAAAHVLAAGGMDAHLARLRTVYRARRDALLGGLGEALPAGSSWNAPDGGMFVWARLPDGHDAAALLRRALAHDVAFVPGAPFFAGAPDHATLRLSFTTHPPDEIAEGLRRLAAAVRG